MTPTLPASARNSQDAHGNPAASGPADHEDTPAIERLAATAHAAIDQAAAKREISSREGVVKRYAPQALERLKAYRWPGNVRELRNVVYRGYVMAPGELITDECLPVQADEPSCGLNGAPVLSFRVGTSLAEIERQVTLATLEHLGRHKEKTAATLGVSLKTLYNRMKEYATVPTNQPADHRGA